MAETYLLTSAADLCDAIETPTGITTVGGALVYLKGGYKRFLGGVWYDPVTNTPRIHNWSFLDVVTTISVGGAVTGTATNVAGTLTATTSVFNQSMVGLNVTVTNYDGLGGTLVSQITAYTSGTVVTIASATAFAGKAISVAGTGVYDLGATFGGLRGPVVYAWRVSDGRPPLQEASVETILEIWRDLGSNTTDAYFYALAGQPFAAATGQRQYLLVAPVPDAAIKLNVAYRQRAVDITDNGSVYLLGGQEHELTILACAMADWDWRVNRRVGVFEEEARRRMAESVELDKTLFTTREAPNLVGRGNWI